MKIKYLFRKIYSPFYNYLYGGRVNNYSDKYVVLTYHRVNNLKDDKVGVRTKDFENQIQYLHENCNIIRLDDLNDIKLSSDKPNVIITFDDGYKDNYTEAFPILKKYNLQATFFITTDYIETTRKFSWDLRDSLDLDMMTWDDVKELLRNRNCIGSHTANHVDVNLIKEDEYEYELKESKTKIENITGYLVRSFAYPFGRYVNYNEVAKQFACKHYEYVCNAVRGINIYDNNFTDIRRVSVQQTWNMQEFKCELNGGFDFIENYR